MNAGSLTDWAPDRAKQALQTILGSFVGEGMGPGGRAKIDNYFIPGPLFQEAASFLEKSTGSSSKQAAALLKEVSATLNADTTSATLRPASEFAFVNRMQKTVVYSSW